MIQLTDRLIRTGWDPADRMLRPVTPVYFVFVAIFAVGVAALAYSGDLAQVPRALLAGAILGLPFAYIPSATYHLIDRFDYDEEELEQIEQDRRAARRESARVRSDHGLSLLAKVGLFTLLLLAAFVPVSSSPITGVAEAAGRVTGVLVITLLINEAVLRHRRSNAQSG